MEIKPTRNKGEIFHFLGKSPELQLYLIGDLDDFFWPHTEWYASYENGEITSIALIYSGMTPPTLLMFHDGDSDCPYELLGKIRKYLPPKLYVHLSTGLIDALGRQNIIHDFGLNYRMILTQTPENINDSNIRRLGPADFEILEELYADSYPGNWFDRRMLETGKYFGYFSGGILAGAAGIHVYSPLYRIAALGNIVTRTEFRGKKIAYRLTAVLCADLGSTTDIIGLNVKQDNAAAIKCYQNAGFKISCSFEECLIKTK